MVRRQALDFRSGPIDIVAAGVALSVTLVVLFVVCTLAGVLFPGYRLAHNWLSLFTTAPLGSARNLIEGILWSIVFAWVTAVILGLIYNRLAKR